MSKVKKGSNHTGQLELPVMMDVASARNSFHSVTQSANKTTKFSDIERELMKAMDAKSSRYVW